MAFFRVARNVSGLAPVWWNKATSTTSLDKGDLLYLDTTNNEAVKVDSAGRNLTFLGVAADDSPSGQVQVPVYEAKGQGLDIEFEYELDTATAVGQGNNLSWSADRVLTESDTDPFFRCSQSNSGSSAETVRCKMKESVLFRGDAS